MPIHFPYFFPLCYVLSPVNCLFVSLTHAGLPVQALKVLIKQGLLWHKPYLVRTLADYLSTPTLHLSPLATLMQTTCSAFSQQQLSLSSIIIFIDWWLMIPWEGCRSKFTQRLDTNLTFLKCYSQRQIHTDTNRKNKVRKLIPSVIVGRTCL